MSKANEFVWAVECTEVFGGYGLRAFGKTKAGAKREFWKAYEAISPRWNRTDRPFMSTFDELDEYFGVRISRFQIDCAYFGDEEADTRDEYEIRQGKGDA